MPISKAIYILFAISIVIIILMIGAIHKLIQNNEILRLKYVNISQTVDIANSKIKEQNMQIIKYKNNMQEQLAENKQKIKIIEDNYRIAIRDIKNKYKNPLTCEDKLKNIKKYQYNFIKRDKI